MLNQNSTMETLSLISIQHELSMNIGLSTELKPMVRSFMETCLRRLDIRRMHLFLMPSTEIDYCYSQLTESSRHLRITMPEGHFPITGRDRFAETTLNQMARSTSPQPKIEEHKGCFFYHFPMMNGCGSVVFERIDTPWPEKLLQALIPIVQRLGAACNAAMQHEQIVEEIIRRKEAEKRIEHLAYYDALTGLPNRRNLLKKIEEVISLSGDVRGILMYIDLDNFKDINDSLGYHIGDSVVQEIATRLNNPEFQNLTVARLGSDEFGILVPPAEHSAEELTNYATELARAIQKLIAKPCVFKERTCMMSASIGIVIIDDDTTPTDILLGRGNQAMYQAKELGRQTIQFFDIKRKNEIQNRLQLDSEMRTALIKDQFTLFLQPQVNADGEIEGAEALVRWQHPEKGLISPAAFIPVAEKSGFIISISDWVLEKACAYLNELDELGLFTSHIAVNLSAKYFHQADFVNRVAQTLSRMETDPKRIELEITESTLISNMEETIDKINQLRELGIQFSIDDFGTGYSSITYLKQLPIDRIKIDRSFVRDIHISPDDAAIVETVLSMARHFQLMVIAEGVEKQEEWKFLTKQGCQQFQGFYFYRPQSFASFIETLKQQN